MNRLYFGDNLKWLSDRKEFPDASVDLVYLDPPFNSDADYNVLPRAERASKSGAIPRLHRYVELGRRGGDVPSVRRQLPECRSRRNDRIIPQLSKELTDDGTASCRAASRLERNRQPLSALRSDC